MNKLQKKIVLLCSLLLLLSAISPLIHAQVVDNKTVYAIGSINGSPFPLKAYMINGNQIIHAEEFSTPNRNGGPVGIAVDNDNHTVYISFEVSGVVDVFDARTLQPIDDPASPGTPLQITLPGATNVAGLKVSTQRQRVYAVDRYQTQLYVYDSNTYARVTAEEFLITDGAFGIDVWNNTLYVTSASQTVRYYSLDTKAEIGSYTITGDTGAMAIVVDGTDSNNVLAFTTTTTQQQVNGLLTKYNINTNTETSVALGGDGRGVSIHPINSLVYVSVGETVIGNESQVHVYDQATLTIQDNEFMAVGWSPTDVVASTVVFGGSVSKTCTSHPGGVANINDTVTFDITVTNNNASPIGILPIQDSYDTTYLQFLSASVAPDDPSDDGQIDWTDLTDPTGDIPGSGTYTLTVNFRALANTATDTTNVALMTGAQNDQGGVIPDAGGSASIEISTPGITVLGPNGGEDLCLGAVENITWSASGASNLTLSLWKDGVKQGVIARNIDPSTGSYAWTVGLHEGGVATAGTGYTVKIKEENLKMLDTSDSSFSISATNLTVTSANGGEDWCIGSSRNITWESHCLTDNIRISLWKDNVEVGIIALSVDPSLGSYTWTAGNYIGGTALAGSGYKIKLKQHNTKVLDFSDAEFSLSSTTNLIVTAPNGGENLQSGSAQDITWNSCGLTGVLTISIWKDGVKVGVIAKSVDLSLGTYSWTVGQHDSGTVPAGTGYTIKIKEENLKIMDFSDTSFTII